MVLIPTVNWAQRKDKLFVTLDVQVKWPLRAHLVAPQRSDANANLSICLDQTRNVNH
jgi:hypothetical protein